MRLQQPMGRALYNGPGVAAPTSNGKLYNNNKNITQLHEGLCYVYITTMILNFTIKKILPPALIWGSAIGFVNAQVKEATINIDISKTYQTISNFAASDAWACQFVGNWPDAKRNKIADLLFSRATNPD